MDGAHYFMNSFGDVGFGQGVHGSAGRRELSRLQGGERSTEK